MKFSVQPKQEILKYNNSMYDTQRSEAINNRVNQIMSERNEIREFHRKLNEDHFTKVNESKKIHDDINKVNASLIDDNNTRQTNAKNDFITGEISYFPFTHGDAVEA